MPGTEVSTANSEKNNNRRLNQKHSIKPRPRSQDAAYRPRSPIVQAFFPHTTQKQQQQEEHEDETDEDNEKLSDNSVHQIACPWNKVKRLRSKENAKGSAKDELHPRAWGVRSPKEIPCTCRISSNDPRRYMRKNASNIIPLLHQRSPAHVELNKTIVNACKQIEKMKIILTKEEAVEYTTKIKSMLDKKVKIQELPNERKTARKVALSSAQQKTNQIPTTIALPKEPVRDNRPLSSAAARQVPVDNVILTNQGITMTPTAVVGTMESTNYVIELSAQPGKQGTGEIKNLISHVIPMPMVEKPKLVSVDGAYFAEIPNDFAVAPVVNQACPDSGVLRKRTENVTFYARADKKQQNVMYAKPKSPCSNTKYVPVTKLPAIHVQSVGNKQILRK